MDRTERRTVVLIVGYLGTLAATALIGEPVIWLAWATAAAVITGAALLVYNR
ncbi:hypothetical protein [Halopiger xanaduensis]|uniref:Uncharacterized protein n=1 Tax=Halopiger xanaduensis (strain DSM 18323 / JCM 14033 / SH-6) TaxID=797210 RepID=F8D713_HALXS|nr:hypothetical protein [Halopiger xanaduensis]AEH35442.1 hypothetical protein Halxa_0803 [Halopiger xanaduensis SH-6]